jgi:hypothetical protein
MIVGFKRTEVKKLSVWEIRIKAKTFVVLFNPEKFEFKTINRARKD